MYGKGNKQKGDRQMFSGYMKNYWILLVIIKK